MRVEQAATVPPCVVHVAPVASKGEARTRWVTAVTAVMMVAELVVGFWSRSLALTADGWHMATHVGALGLAALAYWYARTRASETRFAFGTGKVYALAGYTSAAFLLGVAVFMAIQGVERLLAPEDIHYREAIPVAVVGLLVNLVCAWILGFDHDHGPGEAHGHDHDHDLTHEARHDHDHAHPHADSHEHADHNLRAAYLHVLSDALTSVLAIAALVLGQYGGWRWVDPAVALVASAVIFRWGLGLMQECARQLVDLHPTSKQREAVRAALEAEQGTRVTDLHLWSVGPGRLVCVVAVETQLPRPLDFYRDAVGKAVTLAHLTVEVRPVATAP